VPDELRPDDLLDGFLSGVDFDASAGTVSGGALRPGRELGGYELEAVLGSGGMGVVLQAREPETGRPVALKLLRLPGGGEDQASRRFRREARALLRLRHPNVVGVLDVGVDAGQPFLVLELVEGGTLEDALGRDGPLDPTHAVRLVCTLASAVEHVHQQGLLHRDLKPANVLLDRGVPRLTDFGLVKAVLPDSSLVSADHSLTVTGQMLGTPGYWSPEQAIREGAPLGPATDVFGLGAILYAALTGRAPFSGRDLREVVVATLGGEVLPPSRWRPELGRSLDRICLRCLAGEPADRYPSAAALAEALTSWLARPARRRALLAFASAGLVALALGAGAALAHRGTPSGGPVAEAPPGSSPASPATAPDDDPARELIRRARALAESGRVDDARGLIEEATLAPVSTRAAYDLVQLCDAFVGRRALRRSCVAAAQRGEGQGAAALALRGAGRYLAGDSAGALALFEEGLEVRRDDPILLLLRAAATVMSGLPEEALTDLERAVRLDPALADGWRLLGSIQFKLGALEAALDARTRALGLEPDHVDTLLNLAGSLAQLDRREEALVHVDRAVRVAPMNPDARRLRANLRLSLGDRDGAEADVSTLERLAPQATETRRLRQQLSAAPGGRRWSEEVVALAAAGREEEARRLILAELEQPSSTETGYEYVELLLGRGLSQALKRACRQRALACRLEGAAGLALQGAARLHGEECEQALAHLDRALALSPGDSALLSLRAVAHANVDDATASLADAQRALASDPERWLALLAMGEALRLRADHVGAERALREGLRLRPRQHLLLNALSSVLLEAGRLTEAVQVLERALEVSPRAPHLWNNLGQVKFELGDVAGAESAIAEALELDPDLLEGVYMRCLLSARRGDLEAARRDLAWMRGKGAAPRLRGQAELRIRDAEALASDPQQAIWRLLLRGRDEEAREHLRGLLEHPRSTEAVYRLLTLTAVDLLDAEQLVQCAERGARCRVEGAAGEALRAVARYLAGDGEGAVALLEPAVERHPDDPALRCMRGGLRSQVLGDLEGGVADASRALELDPGYGKGWRLLGSLRAQAGDREGALQASQQAARLDPDDPFTLANLGVALFRLDRHAEAVRVYRRALQHHPRSAGLWVGLGEVHGSAGDPRAALEAVERALTLSHERWHPRAHYLRCLALARLGDLDRASAELAVLRTTQLGAELLAAAEEEVAALRRRRAGQDR
jgi:tetratricopeptide (TPR) repeat protein